MNDPSLQIEHKTQYKFENLLRSKFPFLQAVRKWRQIMWHNNGQLIVSLVFLSRKMKFCFFNSEIELDVLQRWGSSVYSHNLEYAYGAQINWNQIERFIQHTIDLGVAVNPKEKD